MIGDRLRRALSALPAAPPAGVAGDPGLFGPSSVVWLLGRERVLLAGGTAALLLQIAHPLVAAGVAAHSDFRADPLRRLRATLAATLTVTFGDAAQAHAAAAGVGRRHRGVRGTLPARVGRLPEGTPYRADDPVLAMWVFATLVWTAITVVDGFARRVAPAERDGYYREMKTFARLFGVTDELLPDDYDGLERYFRRMVDEELAVGCEARRLARQILVPSVPVLPRALRWGPRVLAAGILPAPVRQGYDLPWDTRDRRMYAAARSTARVLIPVLPGTLRYWPHYRCALRRLSQH